jgi:hypothetical protein
MVDMDVLQDTAGMAGMGGVPGTQDRLGRFLVQGME